MDFKELVHKFTQLGWYGGRSKLQVSIEGQFEGWYGRASEDWEHKITIESVEVLSDKNKVLWPALKVEGGRWDSLDDVADKFARQMKEVMNHNGLH